MRFFKYLIFILFSFLSVNTYSYYYFSDYINIRGETAESACKAGLNFLGYQFDSISGTKCVGKGGVIFWINQVAEATCPDVGYPINVIQSADSPIEQIRCVPLSGTDKFCVAKKNNFPILNSASGENMISYVMENTSKTPVSSCTPLFEGQCNNKDPYGGCFKVPDDGCTRTQNGSIICPNNETPNVQTNCTGTYCERPPTGCPNGYVSGSFNGKALCVKSSPSNGSGSGSGSGDGDDSGSGSGSGDGDDDGSGSGSGSGTGSGSNSSTSSSTSTNTSTSTSSDGSTTVNVTNNNTNNTTVNVDVSGVISAINNMKSTLADFLNDVNKSVKEVTSTLNGTNQKIDATNTKLDSVNTTLNSINQNGKDTNTKLDQLIAKNGNGDGTGTDLTATNEKLDKINEKLEKTNDFLTTAPPTDENSSIPSRELTEQNFSTNLITVNAGYCPADKHIDWSTPFGHFNKSISFQSVCDQTAWFGYLVLCLCYYAAAMIVVRA